MARSEGETFGNVRFKLNTSTSEEESGLQQLRDLVRAFHERLSWPPPPGFLAAIAAGRSFVCQTGVLHYQFSRERGDVPRYNAIIRLESALARSDAHFTNFAVACSA
jgi:hypothetical protein